MSRFYFILLYPLSYSPHKCSSSYGKGVDVSKWSKFWASWCRVCRDFQQAQMTGTFVQNHRIRPPSTPLPSKTFQNYIHPFSFAIAYNSPGLPCYQPGIQPGPNSWAVGCSLNACDLRWQSICKLAIRTTVKQLTQPRAWHATTDIRRYEYSLDSGFNMLQFHATGRFASIPA